MIAKTGVNAVEGFRRLPSGAPTVDVARALWREWREDRVTGRAAEIAFFTVLSIFPALLAVAAALGSLEGIVGGDLARRSEDVILDGVSHVLGSGGAATTLAFRRLFEEQNAGVLTLGAAIAVVALSPEVSPPSSGPWTLPRRRCSTSLPTTRHHGGGTCPAQP